MAKLRYKLTPQLMKVGKLKDKTAYLAKPVLGSKVSFEQFVEFVADDSTVGKADVYAVLSRVATTISRLARMGHSVDCGELGTFRPSFSSQAVEHEKDFKTEMLREPRIVFTPRVAFKNSLKGIGFERVSKEGEVVDSNSSSSEEPSRRGGSSGSEGHSL